MYAVTHEKVKMANPVVSSSSAPTVSSSKVEPGSEKKRKRDGNEKGSPAEKKSKLSKTTLEKLLAKAEAKIEHYKKFVDICRKAVAKEIEQVSSDEIVNLDRSLKQIDDEIANLKK